MADGGGGFVLDMESVYPTDQALMAYPDWVYGTAAPPATTRPLNEAVCLRGSATNTIMLAGTAGPGGVAGLRDDATIGPSQGGSYDMQADGPPITNVGNNIRLGGTFSGAAMLTGTAGPGTVAGLRDDAMIGSSQGGSPYDMEAGGPPITLVGNNVQLGGIFANTVRARGTVKTVCAVPELQVSVSVLVTTPPDQAPVVATGNFVIDELGDFVVTETGDFWVWSL
jgi:hypothetical protein